MILCPRLMYIHRFLSLLTSVKLSTPGNGGKCRAHGLTKNKELDQGTLEQSLYRLTLTRPNKTSWTRSGNGRLELKLLSIGLFNVMVPWIRVVCARVNEEDQGSNVGSWLGKLTGRGGTTPHVRLPHKESVRPVDSLDCFVPRKLL